MVLMKLYLNVSQPPELRLDTPGSSATTSESSRRTGGTPASQGSPGGAGRQQHRHPEGGAPVDGKRMVKETVFKPEEKCLARTLSGTAYKSTTNL